MKLRASDLQKLVLVGILVVITVVFTILNPGFISGTNLMYVLHPELLRDHHRGGPSPCS